MLRLFTAGLCAATLTACGDDDSNVSGASNSQSGGDPTGATTDSAGTTTDSGGSNSNSDTDQPTTSGMSGSDTEATTGTTTTDGTGTTGTTATTDDTTTMGVTDTMADPTCGDGVVDPGEACDDGNNVDGDTCSADCLVMTEPAECGNNQVEPPEQCDDGNQDAGDGCEPDCTLTPPAMCGNGVVDPGEQCDDGNMVDGGPGDSCKNNCTNYIPPQGCQAPPAYTDCDGTPGNLTTDPFKAIGINCGNDPTKHVIAANATMNSQNNNAWRIMTQFGTANQNPGDNRYNGKLWAANLTPWVNPNMEMIPNNTSTAILMLSTGVVAQANAQGVVTELNGSQTGNGDNMNQDAGGLPPPLSANRGSNNGAGGTPFMNCDGVNDCSDSLHVHWNVNGWNNPDDKLWMQMNLTVPSGTEGYVFDFAYFSSEYPTWYNTQYNDLFIAWSTSETYTGNITFVNDRPLTITSLEDAGAFQYKNNAPQFAGTGFEGHAATGWFTARGSAASDETFQLTFFIADMGDSVLATGVLLDNFRWECKGCIPSEVDSCGIAPQ